MLTLTLKGDMEMEIESSSIEIEIETGWRDVWPLAAVVHTSTYNCTYTYTCSTWTCIHLVVHTYTCTCNAPTSPSPPLSPSSSLFIWLIPSLTLRSARSCTFSTREIGCTIGRTTSSERPLQARLS